MRAANAAITALTHTGISTPLIVTGQARKKRASWNSATSENTTTARNVKGFMAASFRLRLERPFFVRIESAEKEDPMTKLRIALAAAVITLAVPAAAQEPVKVGLVAPFSGIAGDYGKQMEGGIKAFFKLHGDTFAGRRIQVIVRDTTGPNPEIAKRLAQELVTRDKVDF